MVRDRRVLTVIALTAALIWNVAMTAQRSADIALREAIETETVRGDVKDAIAQYERVVDTYGTSDRAIAAQALLRLAQAHQKLGDAEARTTYERIVRDYGDQLEVVASARRQLAALGSSPASGSRVAMRQVFSGAIVNGTVSPDGRLVSLTDWSTGGIMVRGLMTGETRVLARPPEGSRSYADGSVISPDGRQVAYLWAELPEWEFQVRIVPIQGEATPRIVYRSPGKYVFVKGWTPDGRNLLITRSLEDKTWQIAMLSLQDGSLRQLKSLGWAEVGASLSPDGRYIAYDAPVGNGTASDIFLLAADGSRETAVIQHPANDHSTIWSPDGSRILFVSDRTATPSLWSVAVKDGAPAGEAELVKGDIGSIAPLTMTRAGTLYYRVSGKDRRNVYRVALSNDGRMSGTPEVITDTHVNSNWGASLSLDGKELAYYSDRPRTVLVVRNLSTRQERVYPLDLEINPYYFNGPGWLPDGRSVLVAGRENQGPNYRLYRVDLATRNVTEAGPWGAGFKVSPDGTSVFAQGHNSESLQRIDLKTGQVSVLREVPSSNDLFFRSPAVSPDGRRLAYVHNGEILVSSATGGDPQMLLRHPDTTNVWNTLAWTPDQRHILFTRPERSNQSIWRVAAAGGDAQPVGVMMNARIKGPQVHPDGRSLFFTAVTADSDQIWALEHFLPASNSTR